MWGRIAGPLWKPLTFIEHKSLLSGGLLLLWLWDGCDEFRTAAGFDDFLGGLPRLIKFPNVSADIRTENLGSGGRRMG